MSLLLLLLLPLLLKPSLHFWWYTSSLKWYLSLDRPRRMIPLLQRLTGNFCPCWYQELWWGLVSGVQVWEEGAPEKHSWFNSLELLWSSNELEWKKQVSVMYILNQNQPKCQLAVRKLPTHNTRAIIVFSPAFWKWAGDDTRVCWKHSSTWF